MKKALSLVLIFVLVTGLFAGCGGNPDTANSTPAQDTPSTAQSAPAPQTETSDLPEEASLQGSATEVPEGPVYEVSYPLTEEPITLTMLHPEPMLGPLSGRCGVDSYGDVAGVQKVAEATGVSIEWRKMTMFTASEDFNLVVASGDYPDMLSSVANYYAGGQMKAFEDEVIIDLSNCISQYAPLYYQAIQSDGELFRQTRDDEGRTLAIYAIYDEAINNEGAMIRKDWLDQVGKDVPTTFEELTDVMTAIQSQLGVTNPIYVNESTNFLSYGFGVKGFDMVSSTIPIYQVDGQVRCSFVEDDYRDYITQLADWYEAGLIDPNFMEFSSDLMSGEVEVEINAQRIAIWSGMVTNMTNYYSNAPVDTFEVVPAVITTDGDKDHITLATRSQDALCITTACENVEAALGWINYWFTDEGSMLYNYGVEGDTYVMDNGTPVYTGKVMNNELGVDPTLFCRTFSLAGCSFGYTVQERIYLLYEDYQTEAQQFWTDHTDGIRGVPTLSMTPEESDVLSAYGTDLTTYASETLPKFVMGELPMEQWEEFVKAVNGMHMDEILNAYQNAYDRYLNR